MSDDIARRLLAEAAREIARITEARNTTILDAWNDWGRRTDFGTTVAASPASSAAPSLTFDELAAMIDLLRPDPLHVVRFVTRRSAPPDAAFYEPMPNGDGRQLVMGRRYAERARAEMPPPRPTFDPLAALFGIPWYEED